ncbi:MAG: hypothetical protein II971_05630 [Firmicutes bacterium]|nr:hypothetical protein [Bacillota bacterium]
MDKTTVRWKGEDGLSWRAELGIDGQGRPCMFELAYTRCGEEKLLSKDLVPQFRVITAKRTTHNPQREKPIGADEKPEYQWDTYSDDPMSRKKDVKEANEKWSSKKMELKKDGLQTIVSFDGLTLGQFSGGCEFTFFEGSNLIRLEAVASTDEDGVAYLYHAGLDGFEEGKLLYVSPKKREVFENPGFYTISGPDRGRQRVDCRARTLTVQQKNGSFAVFPTPHRFIWGSQSEKIVGYNYYYRHDGIMSVGIRHNKEQEYWNVRWPLYNAKPGTVQRMSMFFLPSADSPWGCRAMALRYTDFDHFRQLEGYKRFFCHMHVSAQAAWVRDTRKERPWERILKDMGADIIALCDFWAEEKAPDNREGRLADQKRYHAMAKACSTPDFLVVPAEELAAYGPSEHLLIPYHALVFPSKPTYYSRWRDDDQEFCETLPDGKKYYHLKSPMDVMKMCELENMFVEMPHPDTKANDGLPYDVKDTDWYKHPRLESIGVRQLPADNSVRTMIDGRTDRIWNDINNWAEKPRYIMSELDTYSKVEESEEDWDAYGMSNCTYVQLDEIPSPEDWTPLVEALSEGRQFYSTGVVLLASSRIEDGHAEATFDWTFPMQYAEIVYSDGENVSRKEISLTDTMPYGRQTVSFDFPKGMKWARVLATDIAGNSAFGMPVFLRK